jgi:TctA family transporter
MLVFGVLGYLFKKLKYPLAPLVLALVLGDMAEASFRQAMLLSQGSLSIFWSNGLVSTHHRAGAGPAAVAAGRPGRQLLKAREAGGVEGMR